MGFREDEASDPCDNLTTFYTVNSLADCINFEPNIFRFFNFYSSRETFLNLINDCVFHSSDILIKLFLIIIYMV